MLKNKQSPLMQYEDNWVTSMGAFFPGERVVLRGKDLFDDLKELSWMQLLLFGITGREFNKNQAALFEGIWRISASYPEPRIWNNRIASLCGTVRSTGNLAVSSSIAVSEATIFGQRPLIKAIDFLIECKQDLKEGSELNEIVFNELQTKRVLAGFGRPIVNRDERIKPLLELARSLGYENGYFVNLVFEIEELLFKSKYRYKMNIAALDAALAADQSLSPDEFYHFMTLCFTAGFPPCFIDAKSKPVGAFFPLSCERISYDGKNQRKW